MDIYTFLFGLVTGLFFQSFLRNVAATLAFKCFTHKERAQMTIKIVDKLSEKLKENRDNVSS